MQILRQAGASSAVLAMFNDDMQTASPADIARFQKYLAQQSPAELNKTVETMGYDAQYVLGPDSLPHPEVPKGQIFEFAFGGSKILPQAIRKITVYIPAQYRGTKPACVYIGLDSLGFEATTAFDNLIYKQQMPVTIAIGVSPGQVASVRVPMDPRFNRSLEFDGLNGDLARMMLGE